MIPNLLILGGTLEATALCNRLADTGIAATLSLAGRVARPKDQRVPVRVGGFGGADGLQRFIERAAITHVIDGTHPFAAQISRNVLAACDKSGVPLIALGRAPWREQPGDNWQRVPDIAHAATALDRPARRVMLAIGRMYLSAFAAYPQHRYLLRLVDPPETPLPLANAIVEIDRGPFNVMGDKALISKHKIDLIVSKNAGGTGAVAKITAARELGLPVIMIDRPVLPHRHEVHSVDAVLEWLMHQGIALGV
ncbi:cobalt-precorrin-6A reductase [Pontibaca salina]|uniref:Cobalt-precorrin-6A reductase n=1 Tax=Pontibaca salina TaxID=2795731 RepID=A0A934HNR3_9RHOB|nr:cobalt-precorrin-6A reductase [Pontibaca salina]MBI6628762.1 cobalt-precorrin-6A reductase [Pontibaca salina]